MQNKYNTKIKLNLSLVSAVMLLHWSLFFSFSIDKTLLSFDIIYLAETTISCCVAIISPLNINTNLMLVFSLLLRWP